MTEELPGDPAAPSGAGPSGRAPKTGLAPAGLTPPIAGWRLDTKGRCCGRKPLIYRRETHYFCCRCDRAFDLETGEQIPNWAWLKRDGGFIPRYPTSACAAIRRPAQGIEAPSGGETALAGSTSGESPVASAMRPDDPATLADLQRQLAEADAVGRRAGLEEARQIVISYMLDGVERHASPASAHNACDWVNGEIREAIARHEARKR